METVSFVNTQITVHMFQVVLKSLLCQIQMEAKLLPPQLNMMVEIYLLHLPVLWYYMVWDFFV